MSTENGAPKCVHESFHEQAAATPDAVCIVDKNNDEFTYAQVQRRVILLADELQKLGAREHVVAIYLEPSPDFVVAMLAILTAGAAYVPLELAYPVTMLQRVLQDATPVAVVTHAAQRSNLPASSTAAILCLDDREHETKDQRSLSELLCLYNSWPAVSLDDLAFVVYSSGTTGAPKGIANPHRAPALSYNWRFGLVDYGEDDRVACNVFFVWEALRPVMRGGAVIPVPASVIFDGEELGEFLEEKRVTEMLFTPSLLVSVYVGRTSIFCYWKIGIDILTLFI
jgi:non-ribosomal peptide synthetase component F